MKSRIQILISTFMILSVFFTVDSNAQLFEIPFEEKLENSSLIIEGEVLESQSYFGRPGEIYTAHNIAVCQTIIGSRPENDMITVITKGGQVDGQYESWTHQLTLKNGESGIFFLTSNKRPEIGNDRFQSPAFHVYSGLQGFLKYKWIKGRKIASEPFHAYSDVLQVIEKIKGSQIEPTLYSESEEENCIIYSFEPAVSSDPAYVAIDVKVRLLYGSEKLYKSSLVIEYDTTFWGSNVVANGVVSVADGTISSSSAYSLTASDYAANTLKVLIDQTGNLTGLFTLTTQKSQLAKILIPIENLPGADSFEFVYELMEQDNEYYNPATERGEPFRCIEVEDGVLLVDPDISDFSPKIVAAGVRDFSLNNSPIPGKITIYGSGFGVLGVDFDTTDLGDDYRVEFKHANLGPTGNWVSPGVRNDYVFWTDDSIQVYVPSIGEFANNGLIEQDNYCGTGTIRVVSGTNFLGIERRDESDSTLVVVFSVKNGTTNAAMKPALESVRGKIMNFFDGGIPFYYNANVPEAVKFDVEWAMSEWRCKTGVNFNLQEKSNIPASDTLFACEIIWDDLDAGVSTSTGAFVSFSDAIEPCFSQVDTTVLHSRHRFNTLCINKNLNWHMGPDSIGLNFDQHDLRSALLHEFGHCHYIQHSLDETELMYYKPEDNSKYYRQITNGACLAGLHVSAFSVINNPTINCGNSLPMQAVSQGDCNLVFTNNVIDVLEVGSISIYPSPTSHEITIEFDKPFDEESEVHIVNSIGQKMYSSRIPKFTIEKNIEVGSLLSGIYYVLIEFSDEQSYSTKFIKL